MDSEATISGDAYFTNLAASFLNRILRIAGNTLSAISCGGFPSATIITHHVARDIAETTLATGLLLMA
jgi:hypothetical protein